ncbi:hypothetical protein jhhlp_004380 [Lomentospora prolificans]|uniref:arginyltransferase n=1 Tax=Lomentospora prolificans TaxID=41688 RepID=A0A2N3NBF0_9PEZI|nr:hypothetical protein jhhlp_004380 [Lomentospora prolificans]
MVAKFPNIGYTNSSNCGYCGGGGRKKSYSYYASAVSLTPEFYQSLLDRTWRRSGSLLYRPDPRSSCCPHYTLRLDTDLFYPTKDQRQAVNRFNKHVIGEAYAREAARLYPRSREEAKKRDNIFDLTERIHEAEVDYLKSPPEPGHSFTVIIEDDAFTEEKYKVFENYQMKVHKETRDSITRSGFTRFLCNSPITRRTETSKSGKTRRLGSFHQCYRIDGELVAVGVIDLLPQCVSAVYFFYHESIHKFSPGKLGALREIALAKEEGYKWWYPGFYIHNCPKMRYKIDYSPQFILDPETLAWEPLDAQVLKILDKDAYVGISKTLKDSHAAPDDNPDDDDDADDEAAGPEQSSPLVGDEIMDDVDVDTDGSSDEGESPLFTKRMPGIPTLNEMKRVDLDDIFLRLGVDGSLHRTSDLIVWHDLVIGDTPNIKLMVAELVSALGVDLMYDFCLDFTHR